MGGGGLSPALRLPVLIGLGIAIFVGAWFGISESRKAETPANAPGVAAPVAADADKRRLREEADRQEAARQNEARLQAAQQEAARQEAAKQAAERAEGERKAEEVRQAEVARMAEEARKAEELRKAEQARAETERLRLAAEQRERERLAAEAREQAQQAADAAWTKAQSGGAAVLDAFLRAYPDSAHAAEARLALQRAQEALAREAAAKAAADKAAAAKAAADKAAADKAAADARLAADAENDWIAAQAGGAPALRSYLEKYPAGPRAAEAQAALDGLTRHATKEAGRNIRYYRPRMYRRIPSEPAVERPPQRAEKRAKTRVTTASVASRPKAQTTAKTAAKPASRRHASAEDLAGARPVTTAARPQSPAARTPPAAAQPSQPTPPATSMPLFPREPPRASARYEIPDEVFAKMKTYGEATKFILGALESSGYVERSFFSTEAGGVAMVTRLERINDDGTPAPAASRWALKQPPDGKIAETIAFLRGLFFVEPGHYRTIVFMLQDKPFTQGDKPATEKEARGWIGRGANVISPDIAQKSYAGTHCTALIYEFASDGSAVRLVESRLTGKDHLAKSGLLPALETPR